MKPRNVFLATVLLVLFAVSAPGVAADAADAGSAPPSAEHLALARQLVELVNPRGIADAQVRMLASDLLANPQLARYGDVFTAWLAEMANNQELAADIAVMYAGQFSPAELKDILRFYKSKTGQKVITAMPLLTQQSIQLGEAWAERQIPALIERIRQRMAEDAARATDNMAVPAPGETNSVLPEGSL